MPDGPIRLEAPPHFDPPSLTGLGEGVQVSRQTRTQGSTVYWDTPDLRLARWGCSLMSVENEGWTVSLPAAPGGNDRQARAFLFGGAEEAPPAGALDLLTAYVRTVELLPVGRLRRVRQAVQVGGSNGSGIRVLSDEVSVLHGRRVAIRYRELVLDAGREADTALVHGVIARLRAAGAGGPDPVPEYARVLGPGAMEPPEVVVDVPGPDSTVGQAVRAAIAGSVHRLLRHDAGVRRGDDSESVHQARVATRRLRSDLVTFKTLLEPDPVAAMRDELKWVGGLLGDVRDTDVLLERMAGRLREIPGPAAGQRAILKRLTDRRTAARVRML
ncbi:MAG TPA: CHAD domain-containing protein, partial [Candidatus Dormibacteraeota bacterium]